MYSEKGVAGEVRRKCAQSCSRGSESGAVECRQVKKLAILVFSPRREEADAAIGRELGADASN
jgi:hypothetical protein